MIMKKHNAYLSSILVFGFLLYGLIFLALFVVPVSIGFSLFDTESQIRKERYHLFQVNKKTIAQLQEKLKPLVSQIDYMNKLVSKNPMEKLAACLDEQEKKFPTRAVVREFFKPHFQSSRFGSKMHLGTHDFQVGFVGRYGAIEGLTLAYETLFPNLFLTNLDVKVIETDAEKKALLFDANYVLFSQKTQRLEAER